METQKGSGTGWWIAIFIIIALLVICFVYFTYEARRETPSLVFNKTITFGDTSLNVAVADSSDERVQGLSGQESLPEGSGLLFVFEKPDLHYIWMKDMNFSIDIAWISAEGAVVHIEEGVSPDSYPQTFTSRVPAVYVLEVPADTFSKAEIKIGDRADFPPMGS